MLAPSYGLEKHPKSLTQEPGTLLVLCACYSLSHHTVVTHLNCRGRSQASYTEAPMTGTKIEMKSLTFKMPLLLSFHPLSICLKFLFDHVKELPSGQAQHPSTPGLVLYLLDSQCICPQLSGLVHEFWFWSG